MNRIFVLTIVLSLLAACGGGMMPNPNGVDTTCAASPAAVTGSQLWTDIFHTKCFSGCHDPGPPEGTALAYGDYSTAATTQMDVNKASLWNKTGATTLKVVDGDGSKSTADRLANSTMWLKVSTKGTQGFKGPNMEVTGASMPNDGTKLSDAQIQEIKDWICRGAPP